jgi:hypothetical protein
VRIVRAHETVPLMALVEHDIDAELQLVEAVAAQLVLELGLPPAGFVLIARPALPAVQRGKDVIDGEGDFAAGKMVDDIAAPHRHVGHVEIERAARLEHAMHVLDGLRHLAVGEVLDHAQRQHLVKRGVGEVDLPGHTDDVDALEGIDVVMDVAWRRALPAADLQLAQLGVRQGRHDRSPQLASFTTSACPLLL